MSKPDHTEESGKPHEFKELDLKKIGARFVEVRKELDKTQRAMAESLGTTQGMLSQYERGLVEPPLTIAVRLAETAKRSLEWVVFGVR